MKYCIYCGAQVPDDSKFCHKCGKPVIASDVEAQQGDTWKVDSTAPANPVSAEEPRGGGGSESKSGISPVTFSKPMKILKIALKVFAVLLLIEIGLGIFHRGLFYEYTLKQVIAYHLAITKGYEEGESAVKVSTLHSTLREESYGGTSTTVYSGMAKCNFSSFMGPEQDTVYYACVLQSSKYMEAYDKTLYTNEVYNYRDREDYKQRNPVLRAAESLFRIDIMYTQVRDSEQQMQILVEDIVDSGTREITDYQAVNSTKLNELLGQYDPDFQPQPVEERAYKVFGTITSIKQRNNGFVLGLDCSGTATDPNDYTFANTMVYVSIPYDLANMYDVVYLPIGTQIVCCGYFDAYYDELALTNCREYIPYYKASDSEYYTDDQLNNYPFNDGIAFMLEHNISAAKICEDGEAEKRYSEAYAAIQ